MGASKKCILSAGKTHVHKIPPFRGGGILGFGGEGSADFIFMGARIFLRNASLFKAFLFTFLVPLWPPHSKQHSDGIPVEFALEGPQKRIANCQPKLRTNSPKTANKQNYEQTGASDPGKT